MVTTFTQYSFSALVNWESKQLTMGKTFLMANLDNYSNKILFIQLGMYHFGPTFYTQLWKKTSAPLVSFAKKSRAENPF